MYLIFVEVMFKCLQQSLIYLHLLLHKVRLQSIIQLLSFWGVVIWIGLEFCIYYLLYLCSFELWVIKSKNFVMLSWLCIMHTLVLNEMVEKRFEIHSFDRLFDSLNTQFCITIAHPTAYEMQRIYVKLK